MIIGILIVLIFVVMAVLMMMKKIPALLALPIMAVLISIAVGLPATGEEGIFTFVLDNGSTRLAGTYVAILFSCWLSQLLNRTGVTNTLIKKAAELGGDRPLIIALLLLIVTFIMFTTLYGTGAVAMVGAVVLPILLSIGIPAEIAANSFLMAMTGGYVLNPANISLITNITGVDAQVINPAAVILAVLSLLFMLFYLIYGFKKSGLRLAMSVDTKKASDQQLHGFRGFMACMTPIAVIFMTLVFKLPALPVFMVGLVWAVVFTYKGTWAQNVNLLVKSCYEGFRDGAPTATLMFGIGMIINAVTAPTTQAVINPFMKAITPTTPLGLIIFICALSPFALYRGPFNLQGLGAGLAASMLAINVVPVAALSAVFYAAFRWPTQACPTSTQVVWTANYVGMDPVSLTNKTQLANWIVTIISVVILTFIYFK